MGGASGRWIKSLIGCKRPPDKPDMTEKSAGKGKTWKLWRNFYRAEKGAKSEQMILTRDRSSLSSNDSYMGAIAAVVRAPFRDFMALQQEWAAIRVQTAFRSFLARKALRSLRAIVKIQAIFRGRQVRKQAAITLRCMEALVRAQTRALAGQDRLSDGSNKILATRASEMRLMKQKREFKENYCPKACEDYGMNSHRASRARKSNIYSKNSNGELTNNSSAGSPPTPTSEFYYPESSPSSSVFTSTSLSGPTQVSSERSTCISCIGSPSYMNMTESGKARQKSRFNKSMGRFTDEFQLIKKPGLRLKS